MTASDKGKRSHSMHPGRWERNQMLENRPLPMRASFHQISYIETKIGTQSKVHRKRARSKIREKPEKTIMHDCMGFEANLDSCGWRIPNSSVWEKCLQAKGGTLANKDHYLGGGWTNPSGKYARQFGSFPQVGVKIKSIWNHHGRTMVYCNFTHIFLKMPEPPAHSMGLCIYLHLHPNHTVF